MFQLHKVDPVTPPNKVLMGKALSPVGQIQGCSTANKTTKRM